MEKDLSNIRQNFQKNALLEENTADNPMELFRDWYLEAENEEPGEANTLTISTVGSDLQPSNRVVLLKKFTWEGFIFYTNYKSKKGQDIAQNNQVCASFFWHNLERQIIIKGTTEKIAENLSDGYFESRPRGSQLGAMASNQSEVVESREKLDQSLKELEKKYENKEIPRPKHWGGYIIKPKSIEFWQGRPNRMHDRICYTIQEDYGWKKERLAP